MKLPPQALESSVLVVAHPDDEVLWFGSILDDVDEIIICYTDAGHWPELGEARRRSMEEHEHRDKIVLLDLEQVKSHNKSSWPEPVETDYGLRLDRFQKFDGPFQEQAKRLRAALEPRLSQFRNVFTHNPWGEYGHEDHVQLCRVATQLAEAGSADVWYSSYVSNKSINLMRRYMQGFGSPYFRMDVDQERARMVADTYYRNNAWTWLEDYVWFDSDFFVKGPLVPNPHPCTGALFPVNFLRVPFDPEKAKQPPPWLGKRALRAFRRYMSGANRPSRNAEAH
jgi:LmbE family N-acetylglucosaminyl deacetylase